MKKFGYLLIGLLVVLVLQCRIGLFSPMASAVSSKTNTTTVKAKVDQSLTVSIAGLNDNVAVNTGNNGCTNSETTNTGNSSTSTAVDFGKLKDIKAQLAEIHERARMFRPQLQRKPAVRFRLSSLSLAEQHTRQVDESIGVIGLDRDCRPPVRRRLGRCAAGIERDPQVVVRDGIVRCHVEGMFERRIQLQECANSLYDQGMKVRTRHCITGCGARMHEVVGISSFQATFRQR